ncbi:signal peptide peptidase isoform X6 [Callithrix jacchus]
MDSAISDPHNGSAEAGGPTNGTTRPPSTPEGIALAYGSLLLMALLPIFFGALRSVRCARGKNASDMPETITSRDAARFPIIASCTLLGLYLFFKVYFPNKSYTGSVLKTWKTQKSKKGKTAAIQNPTTRDSHSFPSEIFSQEYINLLLSMYFFVLGILALSHTISPFMNKFFPASFPNRQYQLLFTQGSGENKEEIVNYEFDTKDLVCLGLSSIVGVWYLLRKVFGTNVMVTVAKSFEAPIKWIFIALLLRFDISLKKNTHTYFYTSFAAYIFGLGLTIFIMHIFKHAQPALLYLVPACIGFPVLVALAKGEVTEMFSYESSAEILPHTPRLTHFPTVSGSPASLADSMQQKLAGPRRRRPQNPSAIYEESNPKDPAAVTESKEGTEASASKGLEKKEK